MRALTLIGLAMVAACAPSPRAPDTLHKALTACEAAVSAKEPHLVLLGCAKDTMCAPFTSRGVVWTRGDAPTALSCESSTPLLPLTAPVFRLRLQTKDGYDSVVVYHATRQGEGWRAERIDELPVEDGPRSPASSRSFQLASPPVLSFQVSGGAGVVRDQAASTDGPLLLSTIDASKRVAEHEGTSLWLAPDLRLWKRRAEPGVEAYRVMRGQANGGVFLFEAERQGDGGVLDGTCLCGGHRRWQLSPEEWRAFRDRAVQILDADPYGGECGKDGYAARMEALAEGRWRVVERHCDDVGGLLSSLRTREKELMTSCPNVE